MINPFIANNDSNYLFRKNYQFIAKPQSPPPPPTFSASKLNFLQSRNPFTPPAPPPPSISSPVPSRSLSNSRVGVGIGSSSRDKLLLGKSRMLEQADGWKRELEWQERGKLQAYGAEGLRYNAYTTYSPNLYESKPEESARQRPRKESHNYQQQPAFNDYYGSYSKQIEVKPPKTTRQPPPPSYSQSNFHAKSESTSKRVREHFADQINEEQYQSRNFATGKKQRSKYELDVQPIREQSQRQSKLMDMFGSQMDERFKQANQHNSYASYYVDDLVESKQSKFGRESLHPRKHYLEESAVNRFQSANPPTLTISGKVYYQIPI